MGGRTEEDCATRTAWIKNFFKQWSQRRQMIFFYDEKKFNIYNYCNRSMISVWYWLLNTNCIISLSYWHTAFFLPIFFFRLGMLNAIQKACNRLEISDYNINWWFKPASASSSGSIRMAPLLSLAQWDFLIISFSLYGFHPLFLPPPSLPSILSF